MIAIREQHGAFPETLGALAPDWLDALPTEVLTGAAFPYRRTASGYELGGGPPRAGS